VPLFSSKNTSLGPTSGKYYRLSFSTAYSLLRYRYYPRPTNGHIYLQVTRHRRSLRTQRQIRMCTTPMSISSKQGIRTRFPTADDDEPDEDPQEPEVCSSGEGCWVSFRGAGLELAFVAGKDSGATAQYAVLL
jgi:hypothetical protein